MHTPPAHVDERTRIEQTLDRHQLSRGSGAPVVTTFIGSPRRARSLFASWSRAHGARAVRYARGGPPLLRFDRDALALLPVLEKSDQERSAEARLFVETHTARLLLTRVAARIAREQPALAVAIALPRAVAARALARVEPQWRDVLLAGAVELDDDVLSPRTRSSLARARRARVRDAARSEAERLLFRALEAHPPTRGRFRLNEHLDVRFGQGALEVDLCARALRIAVEIDGPHHFVDRDAYRRDRRKDVVLQRQGFLVFRVLAEDVHANVDDVVAAVSELVRFRSWK